MRIDALTVVLRPRSSWEAVELGTALVRRHARAVWRPWLACTLPAFAVANALAWLAGTPALAMLAMWWLKPVFDRLPLFVLSRAVFGEVPDTRTTLRAAFRGGGRAMLGYLTWRRFGPARALLMPIDVLEGGSGAAARARRRVLGGPAYGIASLCLLVFSAFEGAVVAGLAMLAFLFVPNEYLQDMLTALWQHLRDSPAWLQLLENALVWAATTLVEPFYVGTGFGQYLNRRTEIEGWDIELAFRRLRERLLAMAGATLVLACLLAIPLRAPASQFDRAPSQAMPAGELAASRDRVASLRGDAAAPLATRPRCAVRDSVRVQSLSSVAVDRSDAATSAAPARVFAAPPTAPGMARCERPAQDAHALQAVFGRDYRSDRLPAAVDRAFADPRLHPRRKVSTWQPRHPAERKVPTQSPDWVQAIARLIAAIGEVGMWLLVAALALLLVFTARHWWPWLRGVVADVRPPAAPVVEAALPVDAVALPDDIVATARRLWADGHAREALALVYRAAVEAMLAATGRVLPPGATEAQCLRASQALPDAPRRAFARVVRLWQSIAWAERTPAQAEFDAALDEAAVEFGWRA